MVNLVFGLAALLLSCTCLLLLFAAWKRHITEAWRPRALLGAWVGLFLCLPLWAGAVGLELALVLGLCLPSLLAWLLVLGNAERRHAAAPRAAGSGNLSYRRDPPAGRVALPGHLQTLFRFIQVVVLASAASLLFCVALTRVLDLYVENAMALAVLLFPLVWGIAAWWAAADDRSWRPALSLLVLGLLCTALISARIGV